MTVVEEHMEEGEEGKCSFQAGEKKWCCQTGCRVSAVTQELQVRDGEEAGIAGQDLKQTAFLFLTRLWGSYKGPCCELNAVCSWQTLSAALQAELCLSAFS